jgi:hypothetical protein
MLPAQLEGEARLDELAVQASLLVADVEIADELLRDRRAPLDRAAGSDVVDRGPRDPLKVDAAVLVEAPVLDRNRRLRHPRTRVFQADGLTVLLRWDRAEEGAIGCVDERVGADPGRSEVVQVAVGLNRAGAAEADRGQDCEDRDQQEGKNTEPAAAPGARTAALVVAAVVRHVGTCGAGSTVAGWGHSSFFSRRRRATR